VLTLNSILSALRSGSSYGQGKHRFGHGFDHPLKRPVPRDTRPVGVPTKNFPGREGGSRKK
jgi:hypothetical protein